MGDETQTFLTPKQDSCQIQTGVLFVSTTAKDAAKAALALLKAAGSCRHVSEAGLTQHGLHTLWSQNHFQYKNQNTGILRSSC